MGSGTYDIKMSGGSLAGEITYKGVVFGSNNIKLDNRTKWIGLAGNSWHSAGNWYAGVPNGPGTVAILRGGTAQSISITNAITVGELNLENLAGYTLAGTANLTFQGSSASAINERWQRQGTASAHISAMRSLFDMSMTPSRFAANSAVCM